MNINGIELVFDFYDSDQEVKKRNYMEGLKKINKISRLPIPEGISGADQECEAVKELFDHVFGKGTGDKVCGTGHDHLACLEAFECLVNNVNKQHQRYKAIRQKLEKQSKKKK